MDPSDIEGIAGRLEDLRATLPDLELIILFGSTVKGRRRATSDVDVAVQCANAADIDTLYLVLTPLLGADRVDIVDLRRAGPLLAMEVARSGRVLYERRPGVFRQFQSLASRRYCDTAKLRRAQRRAIHAFLERHDLSAEPSRRCAQPLAGIRCRRTMSPIDAAVVCRKLGHIMTSLDLLRSIRTMPFDEYRTGVWERKGVERVLQEATEAALDVNAHLIAERGHDIPDDYFDGFVKLGQLGILPEELARALVPSAGLRNRLVHEYDSIDDAKVLAAVGATLDLYPRYIQAIEAELTKLGL